MSIPTSGLAALLVVATLALSSCGGDDGTATATAPAPASTVVETVTQTATAKAGQTTTPAPSAPSKTTTATTAPQQGSAKPKASQPDAPDANPGQSNCGPVLIGIREGEVDETFARITQQRKVTDCPIVTAVVSEWGKQQFGIDRALLPNGWRCTKQNVCTNGPARVAFVLEKAG